MSHAFACKTRSSFMIHETPDFVPAEMGLNAREKRKLRRTSLSYFFFSVIYENVFREEEPWMLSDEAKTTNVAAAAVGTSS